MKFLLIIAVLTFAGCQNSGKSTKAGPERWIVPARATVYAEPSTKSRVAGHLHRNQRVIVGQTKGNWVRLETGGWIDKSALGAKRPYRP